jgi:hypothetical protein
MYTGKGRCMWRLYSKLPENDIVAHVGTGLDKLTYSRHPGILGELLFSGIHLGPLSYHSPRLTLPTDYAATMLPVDLFLRRRRNPGLKTRSNNLGYLSGRK